MAALIAPSNKKPIYVDCNAVSPPTKVEIGEVIAKAGSPFVDGGIIGLPPKEGYTPVPACLRPRRRRGSRALNEFGIKVNVIEGPVGAASALKMSYAGITKGVTAVGVHDDAGRDARRRRRQAARRAGAQPSGVPAELPARRPGMFDKAYRFVGEMEEISDFVGEDAAAQEMYRGVRRLLHAASPPTTKASSEETGALAAFLKKKD